MTEESDLWARVVEITHRIAFASDQEPLEKWAQFLTDNIQIDLLGELTSGKEQALEVSRARRNAGRTGPGSGLRHLVTTVVVEPGGPEEAHSVATVLLCSGGGRVDSARVVTYQDVFRRDSGTWRLTRRQATLG
jgi:hypothetical protein